uniref:TRF2/HOY1 PH-like domain-containing protein n=1 Tax=Kalanchoe fedtschenkoi TaxID=63787 RepID=A0A7N0VGY8_KALFE
MVQLTKSGNFHVEPDAAAAAAGTCRIKGPVKVEIEDFLEQQHGPDSKRPRISPVMQQWDMEENTYPVPPSQYNPLDEPSPLGLKLRKSPSLLELIQMQLALGKSAKPTASGETINSDHKKEGKSSVSSSEKLKASNFPAALLKIGGYEYQSKHEGDLVAKCYFAKHKLVWEVLIENLKSKIEIQWSDIVGLKADCPETGESLLQVVLSRPPLFFRETNPQPRKHTLWQASSDFTENQASVHRVHLLKCPQGMLLKHFEKLIQCDLRLSYLSRLPEMVLDSPFFENSHSSAFEELEPKPHVFGQIKVGEQALVPGFADAKLPIIPSPVQPTFYKIEQDLGGRMLEQLPQESLSPGSVMTVSPVKGFMHQTDDFQRARKRRMGQYKEPTGLRVSLSKLDLVNYLDNIVAPVIDPSPAEVAERKAQLEHLADLLLNDSDSNLPLPTDENSVMARVNSLCCLLQKDPLEGTNSFKSIQHDVFINPSAVGTSHKENTKDVFFHPTGSAVMEGARDNPAMKPPSGMMRKDSFSDLLLNLPRIASLPKFLNNISEDSENPFN